jgi:hypothetical protein
LIFVQKDFRKVIIFGKKLFILAIVVATASRVFSPAKTFYIIKELVLNNVQNFMPPEATLPN